MPANDAEVKLRHLLLAAGFGEGVRGEQIRLDRSLGTTTPDVIYRTEDHDSDEGVCIYLDGLSAHLHGNPETAERDREIRTWLRNRGYEVIEIAVNELDDEEAMVRHFRRLASYLGMRDARNRVRDDRSWFRERADPQTRPLRRLLRLVTPDAAARYVNCVPLVPSIPTSRAMGTPRRVIVMDSPCSTALSSSGRRVFASYEPTTCMMFPNRTNEPVYSCAGPENDRNLERKQRRSICSAGDAGSTPSRHCPSRPWSARTTTTDARDRPRSRSGRGAIRQVPPSPAGYRTRSPRPKGWLRSRPCRCAPTRGG